MGDGVIEWIRDSEYDLPKGLRGSRSSSWRGFSRGPKYMYMYM